MTVTSTSCDFYSGWISGMAGLVVGHPIDTLKVRQQILGRPMLESIGQIHKAGGLLTFFRGMAAPLISTGAMNSIYFGFYGGTLNALFERRRQTSSEHVYQRHSHVVESYWDYYLAGCVAGVAQLVLGCPVDLVKVQLQSNLHKGILKGPVDCIFMIVRERGPFGLYKGLVPQAIRDIPSAGLYFSLYEFLKRKFTRDTGETSKVGQFMAGGLAGIVSWWSILPLDVIKSRIQGETGSHGDNRGKYRGILHCGSVIVKEHGVRGLFHGFWPLTIRAFPVNGTTFLVYEWLFSHCADFHNDLYS